MFGRKKKEEAAAQDVTAMNFDELYAEAQERELEGRSNMSKAELVVAIANARHAGTPADDGADAPTDVPHPDPERETLDPSRDAQELEDPESDTIGPVITRTAIDYVRGAVPPPLSSCGACGTRNAWLATEVEGIGRGTLQVVAVCPDENCENGWGR